MKLRMAMIGGGIGSFIGPVHRMAAALDNSIELVAGAFSRNHETNSETGELLGIIPDRVYDDWKEMISVESSLPEERRPHIVSIVTPNHLHYVQCVKSLDAGFNVICDKPLSISVTEAIEIEKRVKSYGLSFCITHNYTGYPMVKKARELASGGSLGKIRKIIVEYTQGWLSTRLEETGHRQASWRNDPLKAGIAGCMADIGTHAFNLAEYISGTETVRLTAFLNRIVEGRLLDDDGTVIMEMTGEASCTLLASQVATGEENNLRIRVYGTAGSLEWEQMNPNTLVVRWIDRPIEVYRTASGFEPAKSVTALSSRLPAGHPEGFIEAFANLYRNFASDIINKSDGTQSGMKGDYPGIREGVRGMKFLEAVVKSDATGKKINL